MIVVPEGQPTYSEMATVVRIADEAAGEFVEVEQSARNEIVKIAICPEEWPTLRRAIDRMIRRCRTENK